MQNIRKCSDEEFLLCVRFPNQLMPDKKEDDWNCFATCYSLINSVFIIACYLYDHELYEGAIIHNGEIIRFFECMHFVDVSSICNAVLKSMANSDISNSALS